MANIHKRSDLGQAGSMYTKASSVAITPPEGAVFVAVTALSNATTFDTASGLVADDSGLFINSEAASGGTGGLVSDGMSLFAGTTIYGRWTEIDVLAGDVIAYIGA